MANFILLNPWIEIGGHYLTDDAKALNLNVDVTPTTARPFGDKWDVYAVDTLRWNMQVELNQDFDVDEVDDVLWPLLNTLTTVEVRRMISPRGSSNPSFTGQAILVSYPIFGNAVGELAESTIVLQGSGPLERLTS